MSGWPDRPPQLTRHPWRLRALTDDDAPHLLEMFADPEVIRWLWRRPLDQDAVSRFLDGHRASWAQRGAAELAVTRDDRPMALLRLHTFDTGSAHTGWLSFPAGRGQGAVTAGLEMLFEWAHDDLDIRRVRALVDVENLPSVRVALRAGFHDTGRRAPSVRPDGEAGTDIVFERQARRYRPISP